MATIDKDTIFFMTFLDDMGGRRDFLILIMLEDIGWGGGGILEDPYFLLGNICTAPNGNPFSGRLWSAVTG